MGDLLDLAGPAGLVDVDPWDAGERQDFARRALRRLGLDPALRVGAGEPPAGPYVHDTGVLFVRPRQRMVRRFLEAMRDRLTADPEASVGALAGILAHEPSRLGMPDDDPEAWKRTGDRLLMPMATNEAQESIARRLAAHRTVAVQGPPGTGKTHTIRNLICHLVAHGKRVLVLAQKEDPLRVLRDGLPEEIQPLCLAVLGRSADQLVQLQIAARELSDRAATLDRDAESAWVARLAADIEAAQDRFDAARGELLAAAEREAATYPLGGRAVLGRRGGRLAAPPARRDGIVPDPVAPGVEPPLTAAEFAVLRDLARARAGRRPGRRAGRPAGRRAAARRGETVRDPAGRAARRGEAGRRPARPGRRPRRGTPARRRRRSTRSARPCGRRRSALAPPRGQLDRPAGPAGPRPELAGGLGRAGHRQPAHADRPRPAHRVPRRPARGDPRRSTPASRASCSASCARSASGSPPARRCGG